MPKTYMAIYEPDPVEHAWNARIEGVEGSQTQASSLASAQRQIRSMLEWRLRGDPSMCLVEDRYPPQVAAVAKRASRARREAERARARAQLDVASAARELEELGLSRRDSAAILGLSHQRVQQLIAGRAPT